MAPFSNPPLGIMCALMMPLVLALGALAVDGAGVWTATRNSPSSTDHHDYDRANLNDRGEKKAPSPTPPRPASSDPWASTRTSQATGKHNYTCDQVANKVLAVVNQTFEELMAKLTEEQKQTTTRDYEKRAQTAYAKLVQECTSKDWTDAERACVMNATSLAAAEECK